MIAFYVQGGGLGHLTRTAKLIQEFHLNVEDVIVITSSQFCHHFNDLQFVHLSWNDTIEQWQEKTAQAFLDFQITICYVDAFPMGLKGELLALYRRFQNVSFHYVARILKWKVYLNAMPEAYVPKFVKTILLEAIYPTHRNWIENVSHESVSIKIAPLPLLKTLNRALESPYVLVVHSGGQQDVLKICERALLDNTSDGIPMYIFTQVELPKLPERCVVKRGVFPVYPFFAKAKKIYTAAGFNIMQELVPYKEKHVAIPLDKQFDDQAFRWRHHFSS